MNIYNITKYHPAWMWYQDAFDLQYISHGVKSTPEQRTALKKEVVDSYMREMDCSPEALAAIIKDRTAKKLVHPLYGTD